MNSKFEFRDDYLGFLIRIVKKIGMILNCDYMPGGDGLF